MRDEEKIKDKAKNDAFKDYKKYIKKGIDFCMEKYVEMEKYTFVLSEKAHSESINENKLLYELVYTRNLREGLAMFLSSITLINAGYKKDKNGFWYKDK